MDIIKGDCYEAGMWELRHAEAMVRDGNVVNGNRKVVELPNNEDISLLAVDTAGEYDWNTLEAKEKYIKAFTDGAMMISDDISRNLTAAGIQFKVRD